jgi:hypothetical protein
MGRASAIAHLILESYHLPVGEGGILGLIISHTVRSIAVNCAAGLHRDDRPALQLTIANRTPVIVGDMLL